MSEEPYEKLIPISQLLLDVQNPRLPDVHQSQLETIRSMTKAQSARIVTLAQHLVDNGPNPASLVIVIPAGTEDDEQLYYVLDGNRRVTALKLLEAPTLADGILSAKGLQKLKRLAGQYGKDPLGELRCIVYPDRDVADPWIELTHRGERQGAGLVPWSGQVAARYDTRKGAKSAELYVLDYVKEKVKLSDETRQKIDDGTFPITNLERLLNTPQVRKKLGIDKVDGAIVSHFPEDQVLKGLTRIVEDLGSGGVTVSQLKNVKQRIEYINGLATDDLPATETSLSEAYPLGQQPTAPESKGSASKKPKDQSTKRTTLIPQKCKLAIDQTRIFTIYRELKGLNVDDVPNAVAVLFRVFLELSVDHYLRNTVKWSEGKLNDNKSTLAKKLRSTADDFEGKGIMIPQALIAIRKAAEGSTFLAASVPTMNAYVHSPFLTPIASELKTTWDDFQPFMEKLWAVQIT